MEYIYSAMLLHKAGKSISDANLTKILEAAGVQVDEGRIKALVAALKGINIEDAIKAIPVAAPAAAPAAEAAEKKPKKEEKPKEEEKPEEVTGLGALFG